jgi:hypothetical protein
VRRRPFGVSLLAFLLWVQAIIALAGGIALIILHNHASVIRETHRSPHTLLIDGIAATIVGAITALVARGIGRGSNFVRWLVGLIALLHLAAAIVVAVGVHGDARIAAIVDGAIAFVVLYILFGERGSKEFFTG